jgi:hypothetical protein
VTAERQVVGQARKNTMSRIYLSYSHRDTEYVRKLADSLRELGQETFYAEESLTPGQPFQLVLSETLRNADAIVFILSTASLESRYVTTEMGAALGYFEERGRPAIIPVVIDASELPPQVRHIHALFARGRAPDDVAIDIATAVERVAGRVQAREEEKLEVRERVESNAAKFIETSLAELRKRESRFQTVAYGWYSVAYLSLGAGLGIALWRAFHLSGHLRNWIDFAGFAAVGAVVLGLLVAVARFAFMLGKSFMVEALRNSDRIHAISFGEFYLRAFPDKLEWTQVKDAFQHWNIDKGSSFLGQSPADFDHEIFRTAMAVAEVLRGAKGKAGS